MEIDIKQIYVAVLLTFLMAACHSLIQLSVLSLLGWAGAGQHSLGIFAYPKINFTDIEQQCNSHLFHHPKRSLTSSCSSGSEKRSKMEL